MRTRLASSTNSNSNRTRSFPNLANLSFPFNPQELAISQPNLSQSSPPAKLRFQLLTTQCSNLLKFLLIYSSFTSTLTILLSLLHGLFTISTYNLPEALSSYLFFFLSKQTSSFRKLSAIANHPPLSPLFFGMYMLYIFFSRSTTPNRIKQPALLASCTRE